eukprot:763702-Hanusia_phi.AAC.1
MRSMVDIGRHHQLTRESNVDRIKTSIKQAVIKEEDRSDDGRLGKGRPRNTVHLQEEETESCDEGLLCVPEEDWSDMEGGGGERSRNTDSVTDRERERKRDRKVDEDRRRETTMERRGGKRRK